MLTFGCNSWNWFESSLWVKRPWPQSQMETIEFISRLRNSSKKQRCFVIVFSYFFPTSQDETQIKSWTHPPLYYAPICIAMSLRWQEQEKACKWWNVHTNTFRMKIICTYHKKRKQSIFTSINKMYVSFNTKWTWVRFCLTEKVGKSGTNIHSTIGKRIYMFHSLSSSLSSSLLWNNNHSLQNWPNSLLNRKSTFPSQQRNS